ncbi:monooxygenase [Marinomonas agarivorans]|nr:monooxygenase [Marinomonas agarivorans]
MTTAINTKNPESITVGIIGAGPAGLTSAKQALARGFKVIVYEKQKYLGGIWNKYGKGAYPSVKMQSSKMSFHFSDFAPRSTISDFPTRDEVYEYLVEYADAYHISPHIRYNTSVTRIEKLKDQWQITSTHNQVHTDLVDIVMVASGELWEARLPELPKLANTAIPYRTAKEYNTPDEFIGKRVLVVGGGVSGADIAAELSSYTQVDWSIRTPRLFLPRMINQIYNDELFSYIGRIASQEMPYQDFLTYLEQRMPEYMQQYQASGLLPEHTLNNAIHINDRIVPAVAKGAITLRPAFKGIKGKSVQFSNDQQQEYDDIIFCTGYDLPNYAFIKHFDASDLYEHFIYRKDPSLTIINTPVHTEAFGTACPYFEMIAKYALKTAVGELPLPDEQVMAQWCQQHLKTDTTRRYYDCWLETIRLGLLAQHLPDPRQDFIAYWQMVSHSVSPTHLQPSSLRKSIKNTANALDQGLDLNTLKLRLLKSLSREDLAYLLTSKQIDNATLEQVNACPYEPISPELAYEKQPF